MNIIFRLKELTFIFLAFAIPFSVALTNISIVIFTLLWLIEGNFKNKYKKLKNTKWIISIIILTLLYLIGLIYGEFKVDSLYVLKRVLLLLFFIPLISSEFKKSTYKNSIFAFLLANFLAAIFAVGINYDLITPISSNRSISAFLLYNYHNILLSFSALFSFLLYANSSSKYSFIYLALVLVYTFSIFTEAGRAGQITFNFFFFLYAIFYLNKKIQYSFLIISFLICVNLVSYNKSPIFKHRVDHLSHIVKNDGQKKNKKIQLRDKQNKDIRYVFTDVSLKLIKEKPIIGHGTGSFYSVFKENIDKSYSNYPHKTPHNNYLYVLFELGFIGLIVFVSIFFFQILELYKNNIKNQEVLLLPFFLIFLMFFDSYMFIFSTTIFYIYMYKIFKNTFN